MATIERRTFRRGEAVSLDDYRGVGGVINLDGLDVDVHVADARIRFGRLDLLIRPVSGSGERWVEEHRVVLAEQPVLVESVS